MHRTRQRLLAARSGYLGRRAGPTVDSPSRSEDGSLKDLLIYDPCPCLYIGGLAMLQNAILFTQRYIRNRSSFP